MPIDTANDKPVTVQRAVWLLSVSALLIAIVTVLRWIGATSTSQSGDSTLGNLVAIALLILVTTKINAGRNWARWVCAVVTSIGVLSIVLTALHMPEMWREKSTGTLILTAVQSIL